MSTEGCQTVRGTSTEGTGGLNFAKVIVSGHMDACQVGMRRSVCHGWLSADGIPPGGMVWQGPVRGPASDRLHMPSRTGSRGMAARRASVWR